MLEKTKVILEKETNIFDPKFQHGDPLHTHPEGKTGDPPRVIAYKTKNVGINHSSPKDFQPTRTLTHATDLMILTPSSTTAKHALDVNLGAGFCEGEKARTKTDASLFFKDLAEKVREHALEVGEGDVAVHHEPFNLMKHGGMGRIIITVPIDRPGGDDLERRLALLHDADLNRGGMSPEQAILGDEKGILHVPCGMILRDIEGLEIMIVILDIGAARDLKSHAQKDIDDLIHHQGERVYPTALPAAPGKGDIDFLLAEDPFPFTPLQFLKANIYLLLKETPQPVELIPCLGPFLRGDVSQTAQQEREFSLPAQVLNPEMVDFLLRETTANPILDLFS